MLTLPRRPKVLLIDQDLSALDDRMRDRIIDERVSSGPDGQIVLLSTSARE
jgi:ABC-type sugar transport system ATPase subunit